MLPYYLGTTPKSIETSLKFSSIPGLVCRADDSIPSASGMLGCDGCDVPLEGSGDVSVSGLLKAVYPLSSRPVIPVFKNATIYIRHGVRMHTQ